MRQYFQKMSPIGRELRENEREQGKANAVEISKVRKRCS